MNSMAPSSRPTKAPTRAELVETFFDRLVALKRRITAAVPPAVTEAMAAVTPHQVDALCLMDATENGMTMNEVARAGGCALSSATALVDRLVNHELAERRPDPHDRRIVRIAPTPRAKELIASSRSSKRAVGLSLLTPLSNAEIGQLVGLLGKIVDAEEHTNE